MHVAAWAGRGGPHPVGLSAQGGGTEVTGLHRCWDQLGPRSPPPRRISRHGSRGTARNGCPPGQHEVPAHLPDAGRCPSHATGGGTCRRRFAPACRCRRPWIPGAQRRALPRPSLRSGLWIRGPRGRACRAPPAQPGQPGPDRARGLCFPTSRSCTRSTAAATITGPFES